MSGLPDDKQNYQNPVIACIKTKTRTCRVRIITKIEEAASNKSQRMLRKVTMHRKTVQYTARQCKTLQDSARHCKTRQTGNRWQKKMFMFMTICLPTQDMLGLPQFEKSSNVRGHLNYHLKDDIQNR